MCAHNIVLCRSHRSPLEAEDNHESRHTKLPKRGEQWQQSADVAEFVQKGHVHFTDSVRPILSPPMLYLRLISWLYIKPFASVVPQEKEALACSRSSNHSLKRSRCIAGL